MFASQTELCYRKTSVQESSSAGLVVILYDMLVNDLSKAIAAMGSGNIQSRSDRLKHAFAVLGLLEGSLDREKGGAAAESFSQFYAHVRSQLLAAQFLGDPQILEKQITLILDVQDAWRQADSGAASADGQYLTAQLDPVVGHSPAQESGDGGGWHA